MARYIRYDFINDEFSDTYSDLQDLLDVTNEFYHETFQNEEGYKEDKKYTTLNDAIELWEGSGYGIARIIEYKMKGKKNDSNSK